MRINSISTSIRPILCDTTKRDMPIHIGTRCRIDITIKTVPVKISLEPLDKIIAIMPNKLPISQAPNAMTARIAAKNIPRGYPPDGPDAKPINMINPKKIEIRAKKLKIFAAKDPICRFDIIGNKNIFSNIM